jgi:hypothetical protein
MSSVPASGTPPPATGGNNNNNNNNNCGRKGYQGNRSNQNNTLKPKENHFKGLAGADTALYEKEVTVGPNQATQIVDLLDGLVTYCGSKGYGKAGSEWICALNLP